MKRGSDARPSLLVRRPSAALVLTAASIWMLPLPIAQASCHAFAVSAIPGSVGEGGLVQITVSRDGSASPSQVEVATADETASSGSDYTGVRRRLRFVTETQQRFNIEIRQDRETEASESFLIHLTSAGGCQVAQPFRYGQAARVTIQDDDSAPAPPQEPLAAITATLASPRPAQQVTQLATESTRGAGWIWAASAAGALVLFAVGGSSAWWLKRGRYL